MALTHTTHSVLGIGTDIIEIARIQRAYIRYGESFLNRVFASQEINYCMGLKNPYSSLAVRFAAKEAIAKAFGTGIGLQLSWKSMIIDKDTTNKPVVILDAQGKALLHAMQGAQVLISLSHTHTLAQAFALITR